MLTGPDSANHSRKPEIMADAAYVILTTENKPTGEFLIDDEVLAKAGVNNFDEYACNPEYRDKLMPDFFLDIAPPAQGGITSSSSSSSSSSGGAGKVSGLFKTIEAKLNEDLVKSIQSLYLFNVTGEEQGKWFLDLKHGKGQCGQGEPKGTPDATLQMDSKHFFEMFTGKLKPASAFMTGKLKISGNMQKALKLEKLMNQLKSKL